MVEKVNKLGNIPSMSSVQAVDTDAPELSVEVGVTSRDRAGRFASRRRFIRHSAAVVLAGTATTIAGQAFADCDGAPEQERRCSDNDEGANSDEQGCGRCGRTKNVPSRAPATQDIDVAIERIKG